MVCIASLDDGIFNVFMRVSVSAIRVGGYMGKRGGAMIRGACTDCRSYRVTTRQTCGASTQAVCHMRRCPAGCHSHWLPLINSQGLSAGRSGAESWMRLLWHAPVRASCLEGGGVGRGRAGLLQFLHVGLQDCMCICLRYSYVCVCVRA